MMAFYGYNGDVGECHWTPYNTNNDYDYDYNQSYSYEEPKLIENSPYNYFDYSSISTSTTQQVSNYFVYNYSEPRLIQYEPPPYATTTSFYYSHTNYKISNNSASAIDFNEPEFEEYDPTPYGGGYNLVKTYGKPLPPSDKTCYPRTTSQKNAQLPDKDSDPRSTPQTKTQLPDKDSDPRSMPQTNAQLPDKDIKLVDTKDKQVVADPDNGGGNTANIGLEKPIKVKNNDVDEEEHCSRDFGNGETNGYGYDWNKQVMPYTPYGSGLEAMDLCESIFGHWPCLAKMKRERNANCEVCNERSHNELWKSTSDYLFGSPFNYGEQNDGGNNGYYVYGNGSYYQYPY